MPELKAEYLFLFLAFVVPGFISMHVYGLRRPVKAIALKDSILEAVTFSLINVSILFWPILNILEPSVSGFTWHTYWKAIGILIVAPMIWPLVYVWATDWLAEKGWLLQTAPTSWDHFFRSTGSCWVLIRLTNDQLIGGRYGPNSYASTFPEAGHLYIEEIWTVDQEGRFLARVDKTKGMILRPTDYKTIELFEDR